MSKEAEEFFRQKTIENAKRPRMKKFLALVNREAEGRILQEYADQQLRLYGVVNCNCDKDSAEDLDYDVVHLINNTYQVVGRQTQTVWKQGTMEECNDWVQL